MPGRIVPALLNSASTVPKASSGGGHHAGHLGAAGHVDLARHGLAALALDQLDRLAGLAEADVGGDDGGTLGGEAHARWPARCPNPLR